MNFDSINALSNEELNLYYENETYNGFFDENDVLGAWYVVCGCTSKTDGRYLTFCHPHSVSQSTLDECYWNRTYGSLRRDANHPNSGAVCGPPLRYNGCWTYLGAPFCSSVCRYQ